MTAALFDAAGAAVRQAGDRHGGDRRQERERRRSSRSRRRIRASGRRKTRTCIKLLLTVKDAAGAVLEVIPQNVGFRSVEIKGGRFLVNGQAILIKGVEPPRAQRGHRQVRAGRNR